MRTAQMVQGWDPSHCHMPWARMAPSGPWRAPTPCSSGVSAVGAHRHSTAPMGHALLL